MRLQAIFQKTGCNTLWHKILWLFCLSLSIIFGYYASMDENIVFGILVTLLTLCAFDTIDLAYFLPLGTKKRPFWLFLIFFIFFRTFFYDVMYVPSGSMTPTLLTGDYVLVKKCAYGFSKESLWPFGKLLPWLPSIQWRTPERGEAIVWTRANDAPFMYYVKRAVAISNDTYQMKDGMLWINNQISTVKKMPNQVVKYDDGNDRLINFFEETSPDKAITRLTVRDTEFGQAQADNTPLIQVPNNHFAVVGDNRTNGGSWDSRDYNQWPPMPYTQIIGKPKLVIFSTTSWSVWKSNVSWTRWILELPIRVLATFWYVRADRLFVTVK